MGSSDHGRLRLRVLLCVAASSLLLLGAFFPPAAGAEAVRHRPIQPGALFRAGSAWCSFNFVFTDGVALYIGAAAHCTGAPGGRVAVPGVGEIGTVVYRRYRRDPARPFLDFALIRVDEDKHHHVNPSMRRWGGPTGVAEMFVPGTPILHYGNGVYLSSPEAARGRVAQLVQVHGPEHGPALDGWYVANAAVIGGDSGSGALTFDGKALGTIVWAAIGESPPAVMMGPTISTVLPQLHEAGFDVELVTAPFHPTEPALLAGDAAGLALGCAAEPYVSRPDADACVRNPVPFPLVADAGALAPLPGEGARDQGTQVYRSDYYAKGAALGTPAGMAGAAVAGVGTSAPFRAPFDATAATFTAHDKMSEHVFLVVCLDVGTNPDVCSDALDTDLVARGIDSATLSASIPASTWVAHHVYQLYAGTDGPVAVGTTGTVTGYLRAGATG